MRVKTAKERVPENITHSRGHRLRHRFPLLVIFLFLACFQRIFLVVFLLPIIGACVEILCTSTGNIL